MAFNCYWIFIILLYSEIHVHAIDSTKKIPRQILNMLQNVDDFDSFVDIFQIKQQITNFSVEHHRRRNNDVGAVAKLQNEKCRPRPMLVKVEQPNSVTAFRYPFYVTLHRCNGSCGANPFLSKCAPAEIASLHLHAAEVSWDSSNNAIKTPKIVLIPVHNETRCVCECNNKMEGCNKFQVWDERSCSCECTEFCPRHYDYTGGHKCCSCSKKLRCPWKKRKNPKKCTCECKKTKCKNPDKERDPKTCKCRCKFKVCRYGILDPKTCKCKGGNRIV